MTVLHAARHVLVNYDGLLSRALRGLRLRLGLHADHSGVICGVNEHLRAIDDVLVRQLDEALLDLGNADLLRWGLLEGDCLCLIEMLIPAQVHFLGPALSDRLHFFGLSKALS